MSFIESTLSDTRRHLYPAYMILEEANRTYNPLTSPYIRIKKPRATIIPWIPERVEETLQSERSTADTMLVLKELKAARRATLIAGEKRLVEVRQQMEEEENVRRAKVEGTLLECGCCYEDFPMNRMVHCQNEQTIHWFCRPCTRQTAENEIGNSKYQIKCMSMEGCESGFSRATKMQFLDEKTLIALDRNEQEEMLRLAGIENLASCPFCPFAAEYPPVEENREFRCQAPDCEKISCRLCQEESHIPKSCAEHAKDKGLSVRRQIEEAMSAALIRKCNKCGTPFIKEEGCNKMTCTRSGCYNIQCYVCSKSCSYDHFNDRSRGGKPGNCPLFENVEERHQQEVSKAEKEALALVRQEHPEYTEEDLKIKVSEEVKKDEERKRSMPPRHPIHGPFAHRMPPGMPVPARGKHCHARTIFPPSASLH
jgi:TRIAD3 protein (E3 ubiquitin-protein ligase RNF216)